MIHTVHELEFLDPHSEENEKIQPMTADYKKKDGLDGFQVSFPLVSSVFFSHPKLSHFNIT